MMAKAKAKAEAAAAAAKQAAAELDEKTGISGKAAAAKAAVDAKAKEIDEKTGLSEKAAAAKAAADAKAKEIDEKHGLSEKAAAAKASAKESAKSFDEKTGISEKAAAAAAATSAKLGELDQKLGAMIDGGKMKGSPTIHMVWSVPPDKVTEVDAFWAEHEAFMNANHVMGNAEVEGKSRLYEYYIAKGPEMKDAMAETPEPTGNLLYIMSETYVADEDIAKHMEMGKTAGDLFPKLMELKGLYEKHIDIGSVKVLTCFQDLPQTVVTAEKGQPCIHAVWKVPSDKVATVDAFWAKHESFMRSTHGLGTSTEEGKVKLTSFHIAKGPEMEDALQDPPVPTGKEIYFMSEAYVEGGDIGKHMELAAALGEAPDDLLPALKALHGEVGFHIDVGTATVICCMSKPVPAAPEPEIEPNSAVEPAAELGLPPAGDAPKPDT